MMAGQPVDLGLDGKVALVTAASEGLGLACAEHLAAAGCRMAICGRRPEPLEAAEAGLRGRGRGEVLSVAADIADAEAVSRLTDAVLERYGRLDILVVNSGHIAYGGLEELDDADWYHAFELLTMSAVRMARRAVPVMRDGGGGDIVFIGSATIAEPPPQLLLSTVMRLGVLGLATSLAGSVAADNIRVNTVAPGYFYTGRVRRRVDSLAAEEGLTREEAGRRIAGEVPMGRMGEADELGALVAFVVSRRAGYMSGAMIDIDGAWGRAVPR